MNALPRALITKQLFLTLLESGSLLGDIVVRFLEKAPFLVYRWPICPHSSEEQRLNCLSCCYFLQLPFFFTKALILLIELQFSWMNHLPEVLFLIIWYLVPGFLFRILIGHIYSCTSWVSVSITKYLWWLTYKVKRFILPHSYGGLRSVGPIILDFLGGNHMSAWGGHIEANIPISYTGC